jgi:hypothetical protein
MSRGVTTREFVMSDYDDTIALWAGVEGVEICEGDSREEIAAYLKRNPGLSRVAVTDDKIVGAALAATMDGADGFIISPSPPVIADKKSGNSCSMLA